MMLLLQLLQINIHHHDGFPSKKKRNSRKQVPPISSIAPSVERPSSKYHLFVTFMLNAAWPEIQSMLQEVGQAASEKPDIVDRVFHIVHERHKRKGVLKTLACNIMLT
uniref:Helitron helicase-like domain-containing protein n=1 Tax=Aegilops tauschii subsp. strangulata TaxID=200361 RepID=A0A453HLN5_AEGTS